MASEIRVDKINSLSGVGTVTLSPTGVDIAGITTVATFKVGTGVTASSDGDIFATGVTTSTTFSGNFSGGTVSGTTGTFTGAATLGNGSGLNFGDTGARIIGETGASGLLRFDTNGGEKVRIDASGRFLIGTTTEGQENADDLTVAGSSNSGITIRSGTSSFGQLFFSDGTSGDDEYRGIVGYSHADNFMKFHTNAVERVRIASDGQLKHTYDITSNGDAGLILDTDDATKASSILFRGNTESRARIDVQRLAGDGAQVKIQVSQMDNSNTMLDAMTIAPVSSGDTTPDVTLTGNLKFASGNGIDFSAQTATSATGATTSTEVLDHYEEGTFTPYSPSLTVDYGTGHYIRIGSYVCASIRVKIPSNSNANTFVIDGLPFNCRSYSGTYHNGGYLMYSGGNSYGAAAGVLIYDNSDRVQMYTLGGGNIMLTNLDNVQVRIQVHYFV